MELTNSFLWPLLLAALGCGIYSCGQTASSTKDTYQDAVEVRTSSDVLPSDIKDTLDILRQDDLTDVAEANVTDIFDIDSGVDLENHDASDTQSPSDADSIEISEDAVDLEETDSLNDDYWDVEGDLNTGDLGDAQGNDTVEPVDCEQLCSATFCGPPECADNCALCEPGFQCHLTACVAVDGSCYDADDASLDGCNEGVVSEFQVGDISPFAAPRPDVIFTSSPEVPDGEVVYVWHTDGPASNSAEVTFCSHKTGSKPGLPSFVPSAYQNGPLRYPRTLSVEGGGFIAVWESHGNGYEAQDGENSGIFARAFETIVSPTSAEVQINVHWSGHQRNPGIAQDQASGSVFAVWDSENVDGDETAISGRFFSDTLEPLSGELQLNSFEHGSQESPDVAAVEGGFLVVWYSCPPDEFEQGGQPGGFCRIMGRVFDTSGTPKGEEFLVAGKEPFIMVYPRVVPVEDHSKAVVVWQSNGEDGYDWGVFMRAFDSSGAPITEQATVPVTTKGKQERPAVAELSNGTIVVAWDSGPGFFDPDIEKDKVYLRLFAPDLTPLSGEIRADSNDLQAGFAPALTPLPNGEFVAVWWTWKSNLPNYIAAMRFDSEGNRLYY